MFSGDLRCDCSPCYGPCCGPSDGRGRPGRDRRPSGLQSSALRRDGVQPSGPAGKLDESSTLRATYNGYPLDTSSP